MEAKECPLITLAMLPASSSDTHRVSRVPWFPTISLITHGALNERTTEDCRGCQTRASWAMPSAELAAAPPPRRPSSPHSWGLGLHPGSRPEDGWGPYPISRWSGGPLSLAILALLPLWTRNQH